MMERIYTFVVCSALALIPAGAAASTTVVASKTDVENFLGGNTGRAVCIDQNDGGKIWWIDFADMTPRKLSDDTYCSEPLLSPDGTGVVYGIYNVVNKYDASQNSGNSYVRSLSGGARIQVGGMAVAGKHAFAPHWWVHPNTGDEYIIYMDAYEKDQQTASGRGTWKQKIVSSQPSGSPTKILDHAFDGGLSKDGKWVGEAYHYCYMARTMDLGGGDGWAMTSRLDGGAQCCNSSMSPDNDYYIMHLDILHQKCEISTSSDNLITSISKPSGSDEMQNPEYSTHSDYSTFTASYSGDYYTYIANTQTGSNLRIATGNFAVPHFWVDTGAAPPNSAPLVGLTRNPSSGLAPLDVDFNANSSDPDGDTLTHEWDWSYSGTFSVDQDSGTDATVSHTYNSPGNYTAAVRVSDGHGHTVIDTVTVTVTGNQAPIIGLTANPASGLAPLDVNFDAGSSDPESDPLTHEWDWSYSGSFSSDYNSGSDPTPPTYTYTSVGTYTAAVKVSDDQGNFTIDTIQIVAQPNQPPQVDLTAPVTSGTAPLTVDFDAGTSDPEGDTLTHEWDWDYSGAFSADDNTGATKTNSHQYTTPGNYVVAVRVNDGEGNVVTDTLVINVNDPANNPPTISSCDASPNPAVIGQAITFDCSASDPDGDPLTYYWNFDDGNNASGATVAHAYSSAGIYTAHVDVTDGRGGGDGQDIAVTVTSGIHMRINCGSNTYDVTGWERDDAYVSGGEDWTNDETVDTAGVANAAPPSVYKSVRHRVSASMSYPAFDFPVQNGDYTVRLHFADKWGGAADPPSPRYINVDIEGQRVLSSYDISSDAGGTSRAVVKSFSVTVSDGDGMTIEFGAEDGGDSFVGGIEVISEGGESDPGDKAFDASFVGGGCAPGTGGAGLAGAALCLALFAWSVRGRGRRQ